MAPRVASAAGAGRVFQNSSIPSSVWGGLSSLLASVLQAAIARDFLNAGALGLASVLLPLAPQLWLSFLAAHPRARSHQLLALLAAPLCEPVAHSPSTLRHRAHSQHAVQGAAAQTTAADSDARPKRITFGAQQALQHAARSNARRTACEPSRIDARAALDIGDAAPARPARRCGS